MEFLFLCLKTAVFGCLIGVLIVVWTRYFYEEKMRFEKEKDMLRSSWDKKEPGQYIAYYPPGQIPTSEKITVFEVLPDGSVMFVTEEGIKVSLHAGVLWEYHSVPIGLDDADE